jgi:hypothetical protein
MVHTRIAPRAGDRGLLPWTVLLLSYEAVAEFRNSRKALKPRFLLSFSAPGISLAGVYQTSRSKIGPHSSRVLRVEDIVQILNQFHTRGSDPRLRDRPRYARPGYEPPRSRYADYTGTGNTLNANHPIVRRMILDDQKCGPAPMVHVARIISQLPLLTPAPTPRTSSGSPSSRSATPASRPC